MMKTHILLVIAVLPATWANAHDEVPGPPQKTPIALTNAVIHPVADPPIKNGTILFEKGRITSLGELIDLPADTQVIDLAGKHVYPGFIEALSQIGLREIAAVRATRDNAETGSFNPNVKAHISFNPDSEVIPVTRANGILTAVSAPSGGRISGRASAMLLDGWTTEQMTLKPSVAMIVNWPSPPSKGASPGLKELKQLLDDASAYRAARQNSSEQSFDIRLDALLPVLDREVPLLVKASQSQEIQAAVAFAVEHNLRLIIFGGHDAVQHADLLIKHDIPVIVDSVHRRPARRHEPYDAAYTLPARLFESKIQFCISGYGREESWNARNLPYHAGTAIAHGLPAEEALRSVTLSPAEILGIADRIGSLEVGKDATIFVADGDPLEISTQITHAWVQGRTVQLTSRHTRLYEKYREKYRQQEGE